LDQASDRFSGRRGPRADATAQMKTLSRGDLGSEPFLDD